MILYEFGDRENSPMTSAVCSVRSVDRSERYEEGQPTCMLRPDDSNWLFSRLRQIHIAHAEKRQSSFQFLAHASYLSHQAAAGGVKGTRTFA